MDIIENILIIDDVGLDFGLIQLSAKTMLTWCSRPSTLWRQKTHAAYSVMSQERRSKVMSSTVSCSFNVRCGLFTCFLYKLLKFSQTSAVFLLRFGWTLSPASLSVSPWLITWSTSVARISSAKVGQGFVMRRKSHSPYPCLRCETAWRVVKSPCGTFCKRLEAESLCIVVQLWAGH